MLIPIFNVQNCSNYRGAKLISHTMKLCEKVVEARLTREVTVRSVNSSMDSCQERALLIPCLL